MKTVHTREVRTQEGEVSSTQKSLLVLKLLKRC
ncbi:MAG: hypothetical protein UU98_C0025G0014 [Parcubacteria group bacterium GW2011_GWD2_42_14]|nr:MAG: hypothetical protein UU98_C0025G0014 [Parcubacteria group bacterium GW2011_GWD2_42_14]